MVQRFFSVALTLAAALILSSPCIAGQIFAFQYYITAFDPANVVSAQGILTTDDFDPSLGGGIGGYQIESISGTRTVGSAITNIMGLLPVDSYMGNDNILFYPSMPFLDSNGISFSIDSFTFSDDAGVGNDVNIYFDQWSSSPTNIYTEPPTFLEDGTLDIQSVPEPATNALVITGCVCILAILRRRR